MTTTHTVLLFSYGTLQYEGVQRAVFGRKLAGRKDSLPGYHRAITDVGGVLYYNVEPSTYPEDAVSGTLSEITEQELAFADGYEKERGYRRTLVTLQSAVQAWVYYKAG